MKLSLTAVGVAAIVACGALVQAAPVLVLRNLQPSSLEVAERGTAVTHETIALRNEDRLVARMGNFFEPGVEVVQTITKDPSISSTINMLDESGRPISHGENEVRTSRNEIDTLGKGLPDDVNPRNAHAVESEKLSKLRKELYGVQASINADTLTLNPPKLKKSFLRRILIALKIKKDRPVEKLDDGDRKLVEARLARFEKEEERLQGEVSKQSEIVKGTHQYAETTSDLYRKAEAKDRASKVRRWRPWS